MGSAANHDQSRWRRSLGGLSGWSIYSPQGVFFYQPKNHEPALWKDIGHKYKISQIIDPPIHKFPQELQKHQTIINPRWGLLLVAVKSQNEKSRKSQLGILLALPHHEAHPPLPPGKADRFIKSPRDHHMAPIDTRKKPGTPVRLTASILEIYHDSHEGMCHQLSPGKAFLS